MVLSKILTCTALALCAALTCTSLLKAQESFHTYQTADRKAKEYFDKYIDFTNRRQSKECESALLKAIEHDPLFYEAHAALGDIEFELNDYRKCVQAETEALALSLTFNSKPYYVLGKAFFALEKYDSSEQYYALYLEQPKIDDRTKLEAMRYQLNAAFAKVAFNHPVPFKPERLSDSVNTGGMEYFPVLSLDEKTIIFTRRRLLPSGRLTDEDFYAARLNSAGEWGLAKPLTGINTTDNEGAETISSDGREIYFTRCLSSYDYNSGCDIYYSYKKKDNTWSTPIKLREPINTEAWESQPCLSPDGNTLYFVSNRKGGKGSYDIWITHWDYQKHYWGNPENAGDSINTPYSEQTPFIAADNNTLYFASDGHPGMGGADIFYCHKKKDGTWTSPVNIGYPINTAKDENSLFIARDGKTGYFASDRGGNLDLYKFDVYSDARPTRATFVEGFITDASDHKALEATACLIDVVTKDTVMVTLSAATDGHYMLSLPTNHEYALEVNKPGYLFYSDHFSLLDSTKVTFRKDAALQPFASGKNVVLKNIFFDIDKSDLLPESYTELTVLVDLLTANATMKVEISGHTDNTGDAVHNQKLSQDRANSVMEYLVQHGISRLRLTAKGYGAARPIDTNSTLVGKAKNRRTEITILEL